MMKTSFVMAVLALSGFAMADAPATQPATSPATQPTSYMDDASYGVGFSFGKQIAESGAKLNGDVIAQGLHDALEGKTSKVSQAAFAEAMGKLQQQVMMAAKEAGEKNVKLGDDFRDANGKKKGVTTTASGLQIETITEGTGPAPKASDTVKVHYTGTLIDGTKFDSSLDHGGPATFQLGGVIPGWTEGIQLMKVGGKSRLVIPPAIAYGPRGQGPIPANATLVFEVELLSIENK